MTRSSLLAFVAVAGLVAASTAAEARGGSGGGHGGNSIAFSRPPSGNSVKTSTSIQYKPSGGMPKHDEPYRKWKYRPIEVFSPPSVVVVSPPPTVAPVSAPNVVVVPAGPTSGGPTAVASQAEPSAPADAATTCLTKEYLETGAVMFRDVCTKEWAVNATDVAKKVPAPRACLTKDINDNGVVLFRDVCTKEWAMNTRDQPGQTQ
jgi:hypothetical protein